MNKKICVRIITVCLMISFVLVTLIVNVSAEKLDYVSIPKTSSDVMTELRSAIPQAIWGGVYLDENGDIVVNITDEEYVASTTQTCSSNYNIIYNIVDQPLYFLEEIKDQLVPHMKEFGICRLDANDATNKLDVQLYEENTQIYEFLAQFIDLQYVNVSIQANNVVTKSTVMPIGDDTTSAEGNYMATYSNQGATVRSRGTIYPGAKINNGVASFTAGPRYSSTKFLTCGHAATSEAKIYVNESAIEGSFLNYLIGTHGIPQYGLSGDRMTVTMSGTALEYVLPSRNCFIIGTGSYTYASPEIGTSVEMHGAYSGISAGTITAINVVKTLEDGTSIGNLAEATYTCMQGDSGAGIFSQNAFYVTGYCYGTQSCADFYVGSNTSFVSYFSMN